MIAHRRCGKTVSCINDLIAKATYTKKSAPRYAYVAPFYRQAKDVAWEYLKEYAAPFIVGKPRESELRVHLFNGAWITLYGADNPDAFRGMYFDGVVIDEYGDMRPKLWSENILPTLADRKGWAVFIGTPKGPNHFKDAWERAVAAGERWFSLMLKASETGILDAEELALMRASMDAAEYEQEFECSFTAAIKGAIYADLLSQYDHQHHLDLPVDPELPVYASMDIGRSDSTAAWVWQERKDGVAMVHHHDRSGTDPAYWDAWFQQQGFGPARMKKLWLPHDAVAKTFATGRSTIEQFIDRGYTCDKVPNLSKQDGINAARLMIPHTEFSARCDDGLSALYSYKRRWNELTKQFTPEAVHDWACLEGTTEVLTRNGTCRMMDLPKNGEVLTRCGWKAYTDPHVTRHAPLVAVRFSDGYTVNCTADHRFLTTEGWKFAEHLLPSMSILCGSTSSHNTLTTNYIGRFRVGTGTFAEVVGRFTERFGALFLALFHQSTTSTIETGTGRTISSPILSASQSVSTWPSINIGTCLRRPRQPEHSERLRNGTDHQKVVRGIPETLKRHRVGRSGIVRTSLASFAGKLSARWLGKQGIRRSIALLIAKPLRVDSVSVLNRSADVWCLTVPDGGEYALANGAIVHNSNSSDSFRYYALVARQYGYERVAKPRLATPKPVVLKPVEWTLDDLWADYDKGRKASILRIR